MLFQACRQNCSVVPFIPLYVRSGSFFFFPLALLDCFSCFFVPACFFFSVFLVYFSLFFRVFIYYFVFVFDCDVGHFFPCCVTFFVLVQRQFIVRILVFTRTVRYVHRVPKKVWLYCMYPVTFRYATFMCSLTFFIYVAADVMYSLDIKLIAVHVCGVC